MDMNYIVNLPATNGKESCTLASEKMRKYLRRLIKFEQMDFPFALWQIFYLFVSPNKLYKNFRFRKCIKYQYARDDPAFLVLFLLSIFTISLSFSFILNLSTPQIIYFFLHFAIVDLLTTAALISTFFWLILNKWFRIGKQQDLEWGFAFDVHLNAAFVFFTIISITCLIFYDGRTTHDYFFAIITESSLWLTAVFCYFHVTFLGYASLDFLKNTEVILIVVPFFIVLYILNLHFGFNLSSLLIDYYATHLTWIYVFL